jgi:hypothetical protein
MVPNETLWFAWRDLDSTTVNDGPFLDLARLKDRIIAF